MIGAKPVAAEWAVQRERSNLFILRVMTFLSLHLGRRLSRVIVRGIALYFVLFAPRAALASRDYLQRVLKRKPTFIDRYRHVMTFATTIHDRVYLLNNRFDDFTVDVYGEDIIHRLIEQQRGLILFGAHFGSFEIMHALGEQKNHLRVIMAMFAANASKINAALMAINPDYRQDITPLGHIDTMLQIQQRLEEGAIVGILADRSPVQEAMHTVEFLGAPAQFPVGPMRLAAVLRQPAVFMAGKYLGNARYAIHFEQIADFSNIERAQRNQAVLDAVEAFAHCLERHCLQGPYNWFNFFDFWQMPDADNAR